MPTSSSQIEYELVQKVFYNAFKLSPEAVAQLSATGMLEGDQVAPDVALRIRARTPQPPVPHSSLIDSPVMGQLGLLSSVDQARILTTAVQREDNKGRMIDLRLAGLLFEIDERFFTSRDGKKRSWHEYRNVGHYAEDYTRWRSSQAYARIRIHRVFRIDWEINSATPELWDMFFRVRNFSSLSLLARAADTLLKTSEDVYRWLEHAMLMRYKPDFQEELFAACIAAGKPFDWNARDKTHSHTGQIVHKAVSAQDFLTLPPSTWLVDADGKPLSPEAHFDLVFSLYSEDSEGV